MIRFKHGCKINGLATEIVATYPVIEAAYGEQTAVITHALDGKHGWGSLHYIGHAIDLRTRHLEDGGAKRIVTLLKEWLTDEFDVVLEDEGLENEHIHLEFQPKS